MWRDKEDWELNDDEQNALAAERTKLQDVHSQMEKYKNPKAPFINLGSLKSLVKELLDKHFRKFAITSFICLVASGTITWLAWPKSESEKVAELKAKIEKMSVELHKVNNEAARLAKENEDLQISVDWDTQLFKRTDVELQQAKNATAKLAKEKENLQSVIDWDTEFFKLLHEEKQKKQEKKKIEY